MIIHVLIHMKLYVGIYLFEPLPVKLDFVDVTSSRDVTRDNASHGSPVQPWLPLRRKDRQYPKQIALASV